MRTVHTFVLAAAAIAFPAVAVAEPDSRKNAEVHTAVFRVDGMT